MNGKKNGEGAIYDKNGNKIYNGDFVNDKFEGTGTYFYEDGKKYLGQWLNGLRHGNEIIFSKNDNIIIYEGRFVNEEYKGKENKANDFIDKINTNNISFENDDDGFIDEKFIKNDNFQNDNEGFIDERFIH